MRNALGDRWSPLKSPSTNSVLPGYFQPNKASGGLAHLTRVPLSLVLGSNLAKATLILNYQMGLVERLRVCDFANLSQNYPSYSSAPPISFSQPDFKLI